MKQKNLRIAIIGAGAAGLTAGETLKAKGYSNVVIFEKESTPGGKCRTIHFEGRNYELGAGIVAGCDHTIMELVKKYQVPICPTEFGPENLYDLDKGDLCDPTSAFRQISFLWQLLLKYRRLFHRYRQNGKPGFYHCPPELFDDFSSWSKGRDLDVVKQIFERFFTGFGYGFFDEVPAAYVLKYCSWDSLKSYLRHQIYYFPDGIQSLWIEVAKNLDVRYQTTVRSIHRAEKVYLNTEVQTEAFDALILACPLDEIMMCMDSSELERSLVSKIRHYTYQTFACTVDHFPNRTGFIPDHFKTSKKGHPVFWYKRYVDTNFYTFYVLADDSIVQDDIKKNLRHTIEKLGGTLRCIHSITPWKYFPHVTSADLADGFYDKLNSLQGKNCTYYMGELLDFSSVERSAIFAKDLVDRFF